VEEAARRKASGDKEIVLSPIAIEIVRRIDALFEIEREINGLAPAERRAVRRDCQGFRAGGGGLTFRPQPL